MIYPMSSNLNMYDAAVYIAINERVNKYDHTVHYISLIAAFIRKQVAN